MKKLNPVIKPLTAALLATAMMPAMAAICVTDPTNTSAIATEDSALACGDGAEAAVASTAVGVYSGAFGPNSVALGYLTTANGQGSVAQLVVGTIAIEMMKLI